MVWNCQKYEVGEDIADDREASAIGGWIPKSDALGVSRSWDCCDCGGNDGWPDSWSGDIDG